ncbi:MAG: iron-containing redox enzyme family protein [Rhodocyclaceae bacterium]|nr:iron-containing redox enzyme family protein [Rhodocyclaceae bacterium]
MDCFAELETATRREREQLLATPIIADALAGRVGRHQYLAFLAQAYHHVRHTAPLLMACGARLPSRLEWLREAVAHYIAEEIGHQEWILNDIAAAGGDAARVRDSEPAFETELMVAYAYDTVQRRNPVGLFGMVYVLEGTSVSLASQVAEVLSPSLDLPPRAFSYLSSHGSLDLEHMTHFRGLVNRLEQAEDRAALIHCAGRMFRLYGDIFRSLPRGDAQ